MASRTSQLETPTIHYSGATATPVHRLGIDGLPVPRLRGGLLLARRHLDLWPRVFGYHEVWHLMVVIGMAAHFGGLLRLVDTVA